MHLQRAHNHTRGPGRVTFGHTRLPFAHIAGGGKQHGFLWQLQSHLVAHEPALAVNFSGTWIKVGMAACRASVARRRPLRPQ
jgi:hypothetical protein